MTELHISINIAFIIIMCYMTFIYILKKERRDKKNINTQFKTIQTNKECMTYLRSLTTIPLWRFCLITSFGYTLILALAYFLAGGRLDSKTPFVVFWVLLLMNFLFIYHVFSYREFHYTCDDFCNPVWDSFHTD